jgi:hypothetical protein
MTYEVPTAVELPSFELGRTETPTSRNPLSAKGVGSAIERLKNGIREQILDADPDSRADESGEKANSLENSYW